PGFRKPLFLVKKSWIFHLDIAWWSGCMGLREWGDLLTKAHQTTQEIAAMIESPIRTARPIAGPPFAHIPPTAPAFLPEGKLRRQARLARQKRHFERQLRKELQWK
ncbi:TPA: hypothetical protein ACOENS_001730, partial [Stenotrophomonas maltophilia]